MLEVTQYYPTALRGEFGTARSVRGWSEALAGAGARVRLVVDSAAMGLPVPGGVECVPIAHALRGRMRLASELEPLTMSTDVLVLHGGWVLDNLVVAAWAARRGVPYIVTAHGVYHPRVLQRRKVALKRAWNLLAETRHLSRALAVHCFFPEEQDDLRGLGFDGPTVLAPNGFAAARPGRWKGSGGSHVAWLGRYDPECKGLDLLLEAMKLLPAPQRPHVALHGPDWHGGRGFVTRLCARLGLEEWVTVGEPVYGEDKCRFLEQASGFVYPSRWDACPTAVLESASWGIPTLVTPYPLGRFLAARGGALLAEPTVPGVAAALAKLRSPEAEETGRRGAELVRELLSWESVSRSWLEQVETLLRSGGGGSIEEVRTHG
jgi:glycosyltransferase involved in cell wall biosynthesis